MNDEFNLCPSERRYDDMQEESTQKRYVPISTCSHVQIKTVGNDIQIIRDPTATRLEAWLSGGGRPRGKLNVNTDGTTILIEVSLPLTELFCFFNFRSQKLVVVIPASVAPASLLVSSTAGSIEFSQGFRGGHIGARTISGDIRFSSLEAPRGELVLESTSGAIRGEYIVSSQATVGTTSGRISIDKIDSENLSLKSVSGGISSHVAPRNGKLEAKNISGLIELMLAPDTDALVQAKSTSGRVELQGEKGRNAASLGSGFGSIAASTTSGAICINW